MSAAPGVEPPAATSRGAAPRGAGRAAAPGPPGGRASARGSWWLAVGALLAAALLLRLWGFGHGLPYAYNADEYTHFVPRAIGLYGHAWNPDYFVNPPAFTYVLHLVFTVWFGGREGVSRVHATDPTEVFLVARATAAALGTLAVWLLLLAGARLFDRRVGLLAAALSAVAFLPVFYSHLALNDVPTLAPMCLALLGVAGVLRHGRRRDFALAGAGVGLACATKYTGGIALLALLAAVAIRSAAPGGRGPAARGLLVAVLCAAVAFVAANPYAVLDLPAFWDGISHQTTAADAAQGKLGTTQENGWLYYLWSFTWGLGWVPLVAAGAGLALLWRDDRRLVWVLAPAPVLFVAFMGTQERFFGRWLLPVFPFACLLAAYGAIALADRAGRRLPRLRPAFLALAAVALCAQGLLASLHVGQVLSREDTRNLARRWLVEHVAPATRIVVEPVVPDAWAQDVGAPSPLTPSGSRWRKFPASRSRVDPHDPAGRLLPPPGTVVGIEDYERTLTPALVDEYERLGFCWVVVGGTQRGRAQAEPREVPHAIRYYRKLAAESRLAHEVSPYGRGEGPVAFNFDWTFNFYPAAFRRPGPVMSIYRLTDGRCAG